MSLQLCGFSFGAPRRGRPTRLPLPCLLTHLL